MKRLSIADQPLGNGEAAPPRTHRLLTLEEAAGELRLDMTSSSPARMVRKMILRGELVGVKVGGHWLVHRESLDRYIEGRA